MKNLILRMAVILAAAAMLFYIGCNDSSDSDVTSGGHVDDLIDKTHGTNEPKEQESYTLKVTASPTVGGSVSKSPSKDKYLKGESVMLTATAKTDYRFTGWSGSQTSTTVEIMVKMDADKELIANFLQKDVVSYTLTINTSPKDGGTVSKSPDKLEYAAGDMVYVVATSKPGYAFTIWSGASSSRDSAITITMNDKKELTANFAPRTYTLTVNEEYGGTVSRNPGKSAYDYNEKVTVTAYPDNGYKFKEWSGAATGTKNPVTVTIDGDKTLSASFEWVGTTPPPNEPETKYTLAAYQSPTNGGEVSRNPDKNAYTSGERVTVTAYPANGYKFTGWSGASTSTNTSITVTMDGNKSLTANFELITYTITFDANGGELRHTTAATGPDGRLASLPTPTRDGYDFDGWYTTRTGGNYVTEYWVYNADATIYAQWTLIPYLTSYAITFDANGGTVSPTSANTNNNGQLASLPTPTRSGYTFNGWYTASTGGSEVLASRTYTANTTIYARWTLNTYTITFNANGGTVSPTSANTNNNGQLTSLPTPTRNGYTFDGWYTAATGGTEVLASRTYTANTTIYAQWTAVTVTPPSGTTFVDSRDGKTYKKVVIGTQTWMAENLNYNATGSVCYDNDPTNCAKYGRLYDWLTAMNGASSSSFNPSGVRGVCPVGWHLPSDWEWAGLVNYVERDKKCPYCAGTKLKATSGWYNTYSYSNGTDEYGFSALPGGYGNSGGGFHLADDRGVWWSATEDVAGGAWSWDMIYFNEGVYRGVIDESTLISVRCVAD